MKAMLLTLILLAGCASVPDSATKECSDPDETNRQCAPAVALDGLRLLDLVTIFAR